MNLNTYAYIYDLLTYKSVYVHESVMYIHTCDVFTYICVLYLHIYVYIHTFTRVCYVDTYMYRGCIYIKEPCK